MSDYTPRVATTMGQVNAELSKVALALTKKLGRLTTGSRVMDADVDMNSNHIYNLPKPTSLHEPLRLMDIEGAPEVIGQDINYAPPPVDFIPGSTYFDPEKQELVFSYENSGTNSYLAFPLTTQWHANLKDYGATLDGIADDSDFLERALLDNREVIVPPTAKIFISRTITIPMHTTLRFMGGVGNTIGQRPSSYIVKSASLNGPAIRMSECSSFIGGGVIGNTGNGGDGILIAGNSCVLDFAFVAQMGRDGVRHGVDDVYKNCNSPSIRFLTSCKNGRHGFYAHDGVSEATLSADANAGELVHAFCYQNGGDGIRMSRAWWWTVMNALTEGNTGWGMFVDNTKSVGTSGPNTGVTDVERCRYLQIFGGDFNEGNTAGSLYLGGYCCNLYMSTANQAVVYGGTFNNVYGGAGENTNWGQVINRFLTVNALQGESQEAKYPMQLVKTISGSAGDSIGYAIRSGTTNETQPYQIVGSFEAEFKEPNEWMGVIRVRDGNGDSDPGQLVRAAVFDPRFKRWYPGADVAWTLGDPTVRFKGVYSTLPEYANDAACAADGGPLGTFYTKPGPTETAVHVRKV